MKVNQSNQRSVHLEGDGQLFKSNIIHSHSLCVCYGIDGVVRGASLSLCVLWYRWGGARGLKSKACSWGDSCEFVNENIIDISDNEDEFDEIIQFAQHCEPALCDEGFYCPEGSVTKV